MFCAISGTTPEEPVVSRPSGLLFERRLIEKHIVEYGTCPVTKESLSNEDLIPVKVNKAVKPRPLQAASIPGMLSLFQNGIIWLEDLRRHRQPDWNCIAVQVEAVIYCLDLKLNTRIVRKAGLLGPMHTCPATILQKDH